jgi:hypothetical protein
MHCLNCKTTIPPKPYANNVKFCSTHCRNQYHYQNDGGKEKMRAYQEKIRLGDKRPKVQCLICKKWFRQVGTHIVQMHGCTAREYRFEYGFDLKRGQLPEDLRALKADHTIANGTINNLKAGKKYWFKKGDKTAGTYKRSEQTMQRLKAHAERVFKLSRTRKK